MLNPSDLKTEGWPERNNVGMTTGKMPVGVKITHIPSGIVVTCDTERQQYKNREVALRQLELLVAELDT